MSANGFPIARSNWMLTIDHMLAKNPDDRPFNARQIQAVMLRLDDSIQAKESAAELANRSSDVGSDQVETRGREILQSRIQVRMSEESSADVSWHRLAMVLGLILVAIAAAAWLRT